MSTLLLLGAIGILGFACQWLAWRTNQPAILYLLLAGIIAGPGSGILDPDELFGELFFPFVSLAVAVILFEGSLTLKRSELKDIGAPVRNMVSYGVLLNAAIVTLATHWLTGLDWPLAALFGAIMVVTGPTVIMPLLRAVRPNVLVSRTLRWEGIIIDPLGAILAVLVFEWIVIQQSGAGVTHVILLFLKTVLAGGIIGVLFAYVFGLLLRHHRIPEHLHNFAAIALVGTAFVLSDSLVHESGLLAVTIMGIWLANMPDVHTRGILEFKESLTLIFVSTLFILLASRIDLEALKQLGWGALGVLLVIQLIARPAKVWLGTLGSSLTGAERALIAWLGPRGIVAAAISAVFALRLEQLGYTQAELLVPLAFITIVGTVVIQSLTAKPLAKWLGVSEPEAHGYLIIGANPVAVSIGVALSEAGAKVVIADSYWDNIKAARMAGLQTYYGNPISSHADLHLDTAGLGGMLGFSDYSERNTAAALRYREDFGIRDVYTLAAEEQAKEHDKHRASGAYKGRTLFDSDVTYARLAALISRGSTIRKTPLTDSFSYEDWRTRYHASQTVALFAIDSSGRIHWFTAEDQPSPKTGWIMFALADAKDREHET